MKPLVSLLLFVLVIGIAGCDDCKDVACLNGGDCVKGICHCPKGFIGEECEIDKCIANNLNCKNGGQCDEGECDCTYGYTGEECESINRCETLTFQCQNGRLCENNQCYCGEWYRDSICSTWLLRSHIASYTGSWNCDSEIDEGTVIVTSNGVENELEFEELEYGFTYKVRFIDSSSFDIPVQYSGFYQISGGGSFSNGKLEYNILFGSEEKGTHCSFVGT